MANAYQRLDNQAPIQSELKSKDPLVSRSAFNLSHVHSGTAMIGALIPVLSMEVIPNQDVDINMNVLLQLRNPLVRPLLNGMRVYFHGHVNYLVDLWEGAKNFLDTGRSGNLKLARPKLIWSATQTTSSKFYVNAATPCSLLDYLGLPAEYFSKSRVLRSFQTVQFPSTGSVPDSVVELSGAPDFFPADCCMAYQRNWRDHYCNKNLLQNNKYWFPDNEEDFILSYGCVEAVCVNYGDEALSSAGDSDYRYFNLRGADNAATPEPNNPITVAPAGGFTARYAPNLSGLKFVQFKGDRFTTALPFPDLIRGDIPILGDYSGHSRDGAPYGDIAVGWNNPNISENRSKKFAINSSGNLTVQAVPSDHLGRDVSLFSTSTLNSIRALETFTVFKERMARTSGDYNEMIEAQYGYNPHHHNRESTYIGGFYTDFHFSTVVQQSQSTDDSPLGTKAGDGNANGSGRIGHIHCRDFGWLQVYMFIVPDVMYTQGLHRQYSRKVQTDMYFPIFNNLAPQAILNKELYISGNISVDNDVFAYEDRYADMKSRQNRVSGFMALPHSVAEYDASRIMSRRFSTTPVLNNNFVSLVPENVDMSVFSVQDEPPFDFQIGFQIDSVAPMPFISVPGALSSKMHA